MEKKYLLVNRGRANQGKSDTIVRLAKLIAEKYDQNLPTNGKEISTPVFKIGNFKIGIESQGDPPPHFNNQKESLRKFEKEGCNIIICATRTRGQTYEEIVRLKRESGYKIIWFKNFVSYDDFNREILNDLSAKIWFELFIKIIDNEI